MRMGQYMCIADLGEGWKGVRCITLCASSGGAVGSFARLPGQPLLQPHVCLLGMHAMVSSTHMIRCACACSKHAMILVDYALQRYPTVRSPADGRAENFHAIRYWFYRVDHTFTGMHMHHDSVQVMLERYMQSI